MSDEPACVGGLYEACVGLPDLTERSRPGCLGYSIYTGRVRGIDGMLRRARAAGARDVSDVLADEFGSRGFSFTAPDGYPWLLVEAA